MRRLITQATALVAAGAAAAALGVSAADAAVQAPHPARTPSPAAARQTAVPGGKLWVQRYNGPGNGNDAASSVAVSPDGGTVFVTGESKGVTPIPDQSDYLTVAYNAATGAQLWTARYSGTGTDQAGAVAVSPNGATVFVTGTSFGGGGLGDYVTVAYRASDGTQLWVARYNDPANDGDNAKALSVSRDGTTVFVTGTSWRGSGSGIATVAYRTSDGAQMWVKSWSPPGWCCNYYARAIVSPGGNRVFVTGLVQSQAATAEYGTVAYNATTGARLWARRYAGSGATALATSPDLKKVYVTGESHFHYGTLAYSARSGALLWARFYGSRRPSGGAGSVAVSPGGTVVVTGISWGGTAANYDYATVAYSRGGAQLWARHYNGPGINLPPNDFGDAAYTAAAPGNGKAYISGYSWGTSATGYDYATVAYNIRTGAQLWVRRYSGPARCCDQPSSLAARGGRVFVTGVSAGTTSGSDYATIAYNR
jgi:WD40 repeat protein